jgi:DNA-directed RNA polymerase alpha subunit
MSERHFPKIGKPAECALLAAGFTRLEQLSNVSEAELSKLHGVGPKALGILKQTLAQKNLAFKK